jgi:uncharacterized protein
VISLLDVSVLVALFNAGHVHHELAHDWFEDHGSKDGWASCPLTENGLLRILSNPGRLDPPVPLLELTTLLKQFCERTRHHFWNDELSFRDPRAFNMSAVRGYRQLTDVYLLAVAVRNRGTFVTLDAGVSLGAVIGARREHLEVIAPAS